MDFGQNPGQGKLQVCCGGGGRAPALAGRIWDALGGHRWELPALSQGWAGFGIRAGLRTAGTLGTPGLGCHPLGAGEELRFSVESWEFTAVSLWFCSLLQLLGIQPRTWEYSELFLEDGVVLGSPLLIPRCAQPCETPSSIQELNPCCSTKELLKLQRCSRSRSESFVSSGCHSWCEEHCQGLIPELGPSPP